MSIAGTSTADESWLVTRADGAQQRPDNSRLGCVHDARSQLPGLFFRCFDAHSELFGYASLTPRLFRHLSGYCVPVRRRGIGGALDQ